MSKLIDACPAPLVHERVINWSDTDAAQIVYTVRFLDYVMEAVEAWYRAVVGLSWYQMNMDLGIGTPIVKVNFDFSAPLTPRDILRTTVVVKRLGHASISFELTGDRDDGVRSFVAQLTCCAVDNKAMKPIEIPREWRDRIENYIARCREKPDTSESIQPASEQSTDA